MKACFKNVAGSKGNIFAAVKHEAKVILPIVKRFPSTCVLPVLLCTLLVGLEIGGVFYFSHQLDDARKVKMRSLADSVAGAIQLEVQLAFKPTYSAAGLIQRVPQWPQLGGMLHPFLEDITPKTRDGNYSTTVLFGPNGHIAGGFPDIDPGLMGVDVLASPNRELVLQSIGMGKPLLSGDASGKSFIATIPVFIKGAAENETFEFSKPATDCSACYDPVKKQKCWGFLSAYLLISTILKSRNEDLGNFHRYVLVAPFIRHFQAVQFTSDPTAKNILIGNTTAMVLASSPKLPRTATALRSVAEVADEYEWWLLVEHNNHDIFVLAAAILAIAIVATCILAFLLFSTLFSRRKLQLLLESLVPDVVIKQISAQAGFLSGSKPILTAGSPADLMLHVVADIAAGRVPVISDALTLRTAILQRWDLYTPINLGKQLQQGRLEEDVAQALMQQLLGKRESIQKTVLLARPQLEVDDSPAAEWSPVAFDNLQSALTAIMSDKSFAASTRSGTTVSEDAVIVSTLTITAAPLEAAERALAAAESCWQFDAFALAESTNGYPLSSLAFHLMHTAGLIHRFKLDSTALARYLRRIEGGYSSTNLYHNSTHAANVLQSMHATLRMGGLVAEGYVDDLMLLASYLSAVVHDYEHGGLTNDFLINTQDDLAYQYNDRSPLENHHVAAAWLLLKQPGMNFMPHISKQDLITLRKTMIDLVLATDMKQHFSIVTHFTATMSGKNGKRADSNSGVTEAERLTVLQMALKCSDLGHTAAALPVHKRWLACLEEEFFRQGDLEAQRNMPISPLFDRSKPGASKSQAGFYNVVVLPMYSAFCSAFPACTPLLEGAKANYQHWQHVQASAAT